MYAYQATGRIVLREEEVVNLRHPTGVSQSGLSCVPLQNFHAGSIASLQSRPHGSPNLARVLEIDTVARVLRI